MKSICILFAVFYFVTVCYCDNIGIKSRQVTGLQNSAGVIRPHDYYSQYNATADAQALHNAVTGLGTDEDVIIEIIANRTSAQRQAIISTYSDLFRQSLIQDVKSDSSGQFGSVVKALLFEPPVYIARQLNKALTAFISDDQTANEILCTRNRDELVPIMDAYITLYNKTLFSEIEDCLDGDQRTFLKRILRERIRERQGLKSVAIATEQIEYIPNAADYCTIGQNNRLAELLAKEPFEEIRQVAYLHERIKRKTIEEQLQRWCMDELLLDAYLTVVKFAKDPAKYYAEQLFKAMDGLGTNDNKLKRIIVSRSEIDLRDIKQQYHTLYNRTLVSSVKDETSGAYKKILVKLLNNV